MECERLENFKYNLPVIENVTNDSVTIIIEKIIICDGRHLKEVNSFLTYGKHLAHRGDKLLG